MRRSTTSLHRRAAVAVVAPIALVAVAAITAACSSSSPTPSIVARTASPTATATARATATRAATRTATATPTATGTPRATTAVAPSGTAAEQTVRTFATASGLHVQGVAELPTAGTDEAGHALVAVLTDDVIQMFQVSDISVLPVGAPVALADLSVSVDTIAAWPDAAWPGAVWLKTSGHNPYSLSIGMLSWDRAHGWREQLSWAEYAPCHAAPMEMNDLNGDGVPEVMLTGVGQASGAIPLCEPGTPRLFRWNGGQMTEVRLATLPAGSLGATANNRAVAEANQGDWLAADTTIQAAVTAAPSNETVSWNQALISTRAILLSIQEESAKEAVTEAAAGNFATAFARAYESSVPISQVITATQAQQILTHASAGEPDISTPDAALTALAELTFRVAAREALAGTASADPAALAADQAALAAAHNAVFGTQ